MWSASTSSSMVARTPAFQASSQIRRTMDLLVSSDMGLLLGVVQPLCLPLRRGCEPQLLKQPQQVRYVPELDELAISKAMHFDPRDRKRLSRGRETGKWTLVRTAHHVACHH